MITAEEIGNQVSKDTVLKHHAGAKEHTGNLNDKPCWRFMKPEILDLVNYYYTMEIQLREGISLIRQGLATNNPDLIQRGANVIETGNEKGIEYNE